MTATTTRGGIAAIGRAVTVQGFGLAGALVCPAEDRDGVLAAWESLPPDIAVVILTPAAARDLPDQAAGPMRVVMGG